MPEKTPLPQVLLQRHLPIGVVKESINVLRNTVPPEASLALYLSRNRLPEVQLVDPFNRRGVFIEQQAAAMSNMEHVVAAHLISLATHLPGERTLPVDPLELRKAISNSGRNIPETLVEDIMYENDLALEMNDDQQVVIAGYTPEETRFVFGKFGSMILQEAGYNSLSLNDDHSGVLIGHVLPVMYNLTHS